MKPHKNTKESQKDKNAFCELNKRNFPLPVVAEYVYQSTALLLPLVIINSGTAAKLCATVLALPVPV